MTDRRRINDERKRVAVYRRGEIAGHYEVISELGEYVFESGEHDTLQEAYTSLIELLTAEALGGN